MADFELQSTEHAIRSELHDTFIEPLSSNMVSCES